MNTPTNYNQAQGYATFKGKITCVKYLEGKLFVATKNNGTAKGKLLKVKKTGGTGANMFAVNEFGNGSSFAFESLFGYNYYLGDERFGGNTGSNPGSYVTEIFNVNNETFVGLKNGKAFRLMGTGGTGHHMFNIDEYNTGFVNHSNASTQYLKSFQDFSDGSGAVNNKSYIRVMEMVQNKLLIGFQNGKLLKFNISTPTSYNGEIATLNGTSSFGTSIVSISKIIHGCPGGENPDEYGVRRETEAAEVKDEFCYCYNNVFIGMAGDLILGVKNLGNETGNNFYDIAWHGYNQQGFLAHCGTRSFLGSQNFASICATERMAQTDDKKQQDILNEDEYLAMAENEKLIETYEYAKIYQLETWPNPSNGAFYVEIKSPKEELLELHLLDVMGKLLHTSKLTSNETTMLNFDVQPGIYYLSLKVANSNYSLTKKIIVQ